jgi:hypothetical protein
MRWALASGPFLEGFTIYEPPKIIEPTPMVLAPVETVAALTAEGFYEKPSYPTKMREINDILDTIIKKSAQNSCTPYE